MKTKILSFLLALSMLVCMLPAGAFASEPAAYVVDSGSAEFLAMLGVGDELKTNDDYVTRAEFISYVADAMNTIASAKNDGTFVDVPASHPYSDDIFKAKSMGIITGAGGNEFRPDDEIAYQEAVKICVMALGYMRIAEVKGGYPYGYLKIADEINLTDSVTDSKSMKYADVAIMLHNFLIADICIDTGVIDSDISQQRYPGLNILNKYHKLESVCGVVKTAGYESMVPDFASVEYGFEIAGKTFTTALVNSERWLGFSVTAFFTSETKEIKALYCNEQNVVLQLTAEDVSSYKNLTLTIENETSDRAKQYKLDPGYSYVKNGRIIRPIDADFILDNGAMTLIDNNDDKLYDAVIVKECDYMVISGNSVTTEGVFDSRINQSIYFKKSGSSWYYLTQIDASGNVSVIKPAELAVGTVLEVYESRDGTYVEAVASKKSVTGTIEEIGDDFVVIDSVRYKLNSYFKSHFKAVAGENATYLISANGTITAIGTAAASLKYGFLTDFAVRENGFDKTVKVKVLDQGGSMLDLVLADKLKLNGTVVENTDPAVASALANGDYAKYQVIKYKLDSEDRLSVVDTAAPASGTLEDKYSSKMHDGNDLTINHSSKSIYLYRGYNLLQPIAAICATTVVFAVPSCLAASNNLEGPDKRLARYDDKNYSVETMVSATTSSGNYFVDIYDMNESMEAAVVVVYVKNVNASANVNTDIDPAVVHSVTDALNAEGEPTKKMTVWSRNVFKTYYFTTDFLSELSQAQIPKSGDIIRITTNKLGEIVGIDVDVKYNPVTGKPEVNTSVANKRDQAQWCWYSGKLFGITANSLSLTIDQQPPFSQAYAGEFKDYVDNMVPLSLLGSTYYAGYDTKSGTVYRMKNTDYKAASSVGNSEASYVITYGYAGWARLVVEYGIR